MTVTFLFFSSVCTLCVCVLDMQKKEKHATQTTASKNIERRQESEKSTCVFPKINRGSKLRREA